MGDPHSQLRTLIAERGGPLPALGYRPALPPLPKFTGPNSVLANRTARAAQIARFFPSVGHSSAPSKIEPGALAGSSLMLGEQGVPVGAILGLLAGSLNSIFSGRPKSLATQDVGRRLEANPNPIISHLGAEIVALAQSGHVLSSRSDLQRFFTPVIQTAISQLVDSGFPKEGVTQAIRSAVFSPQLPEARLPASLPAALTARQGFSPRPGYRVIRPPAQYGTVSAAEAAAVSSPYEPQQQTPFTPPPPTVDSRSVMQRFPWLERAVRNLAIERAGEAGLKLLRGQALSNIEFGALAGTLIGSFAGEPLLGAQIGIESGAAVDALQEIASRYFHQPLQRMIPQAAEPALLALQQGQPPSPAAPPPLSSQPTGRSEPNPLAHQPGEPGGGGFQPQQFRPENPPPPPEIPLMENQNQPQPCPTGNCPGQTGQQGDCSTPDSPIGALARQLVNCPTFQGEMRKKFRVTQKPGEPPTLTVPQPLCLCCDSAEDLQLYVSSGGIRGACIQVAEPQGTLIPGP